jgi:hypothetical protein
VIDMQSNLPNFARAILNAHQRATRHQIEDEIGRVLRFYRMDDADKPLYRELLIKALLARAPTVFELRTLGQLITTPPPVGTFLASLENIREHINEDNGMFL